MAGEVRVDSESRSRYLRPCLLAALVASVTWNAWDLSRPGLLDRTGRLKCPDFLQFYTYGSLVNAGATQSLYDPAAHAQIARVRVNPELRFDDFHPNYSPVIAWVMAPLAALPFLQAMAVWSAASFLLYAAAMALLARQAPHLRVDAVTFWLAAAAWPALLMVLRYGQISTLSLMLLTAAVWLDSHGRPFLAGCVLGALAYKPTLVVLPVLIFVGSGQWRLLAGVLSGIAAESAVSVWLAGAQAFSKYLHILADLAVHPATVQLHPAESHSIRGFARLLIHVEPAATVAGLLGLIAVGAAAVYLWAHVKDWRLRWAALTLATLIGSPHLLTYDLVLLAVPLVLLADWWTEQGRSPTLGPWMPTMVILYASAWPGTLLARIYQVQISTIGMVMALWLIVRYSSRADRSATGSGSSSSPRINS
jgi:alpha-1,2-mannosyltransferase